MTCDASVSAPMQHATWYRAAHKVEIAVSAQFVGSGRLRAVSIRAYSVRELNSTFRSSAVAGYDPRLINSSSRDLYCLYACD